MKVQRFDILKVDLSDAKGSEQGKIRPCVVVGNELSLKYSPVILIMPLTKVSKNKYLPTHKIIKTTDAIGLSYDSTLIGEQPRPVDRERIRRKLGCVTNDNCKKQIDQACVDAFFFGSGKEVNLNEKSETSI